VEYEQTLVHEPADEPAEEPVRQSVARAPARRRIARSPPATRGERGPAVEELVLDRYRLLERLGAGGFGVVWRARDELLHREVALKRIPLGAGGDSERATREALAAARLAHPAIVALYEACVVEDACYLISELVDGQTLAQLIATGETADAHVIEIGLALAGALAHAHARGVIHRDIKPQNVLVPAHVHRGGEAAKLTDFGGASLVGEDALTRTGDVLGTLAYMAPEQSEGEQVGEQADLYALALVLYEALSGVNPVRGPTPAATARRIGSELESLSRHRRDLPRALTDTLDEALAPEPEDRPTLQELREALEDARARLPEAPRHRRAAIASPLRVRPAREAPVPLPAPGAFPEAPRAEPDLDAPTARAARPGGRLALPRAVWLAGTLLLAGWQAAAGRPGVALLVLAALAPALLVCAAGGPRRIGVGWLACLLAPALGLAGLAGAFPAVAGQASRWRARALYGALGYWWLALAAPLAGRRLWLAPPAPAPARAAWEGSLSVTAAHVIAPLLTLGVLLGALLWAAAAVALPLLVRGRNAALDLLAAGALAGALVLCAPALDSGLLAHAAQPAGRGAVLGAVLGALLAVAARALRGPV
jgi:eukaryotic-like serine/threonine-protein kinase